MKRILVTFVLLLTLIISPTMAHAEGNINIYINNVLLDAKGTLVNNSTLVPLRAIFEAMGATVGWDGATQTVTSTKADITIQLVIGNSKAIKNGQEVELATPAQLIGSSTYVPLRFIGEAFGGTVNWDEATRSAYIVTADVNDPESLKPTNLEPVEEPSDNIATKENAQKLEKYGFTLNGNGAFYNSQNGYSLVTADVTVGTILGDHVTISLLNWSGKVPEMTRNALKVYLPTGGEKVYSIINNFAGSGQTQLDKEFNLDGHKVYVYFASKTGMVVVEIYN